MKFGGEPSDPMNYLAVLQTYGSRKVLDAPAGARDITAKLWRDSPALMESISQVPQAPGQQKSLATSNKLGA